MAPRNHSSGSEGDSDSKRVRNRSTGSSDGDYRQKRDRNNVAVRKSREKSRQKARETMQKVTRLKKENEDLEMKVKLLSKELNLLKDLFLSHAGQGSIGLCPSPTLFQETVAKTEIKTEDSGAESDGSVGSCSRDMDYSMSLVAGTPACLDVVQRDHEYSAPTRFK